MSRSDPLRILYVSARPSSPPRFGGQVRQHGLMTRLARRHEVSAITLVDEHYDIDESARAMREYFRKVTLIQNPNGRIRARRRLQLRSFVSTHSFEQHWLSVPALSREVDKTLKGSNVDVVLLEFPLSPARLRSPSASPPFVLNTHGIEHDLGRQVANNDANPARRLYRELSWRKLRSEEIIAFRSADGVCVCSIEDQSRLLADVPQARTALIPNATDADHFRRLGSDPPPDGNTVVFFGLLSFVPNIDGLQFFLKTIWPSVAAARPNARCRIIGADAPRSVLKLVGPRVEIVGFVPDLRRELAQAAVLVVPLRLGAGTRLKLVEGMAMGMPIVSTTLGAEGIEVVDGRDVLIADDAAAFAAAVVRLLDDPELGARLGASARRLTVDRYSWTAAASRLEDFLYEIIESRGPRNGALTRANAS